MAATALILLVLLPVVFTQHGYYRGSNVPLIPPMVQQYSQGKRPDQRILPFYNYPLYNPLHNGRYRTEMIPNDKATFVSVAPDGSAASILNVGGKIINGGGNLNTGYIGSSISFAGGRPFGSLPLAIPPRVHLILDYLNYLSSLRPQIGFPGGPGIPGMNGIPGLPNMPNLLGMAAMPGLNALQALPNILGAMPFGPGLGFSPFGRSDLSNSGALTGGEGISNAGNVEGSLNAISGVSLKPPTSVAVAGSVSATAPSGGAANAGSPNVPLEILLPLIHQFLSGNKPVENSNTGAQVQGDGGSNSGVVGHDMITNTNNQDFNFNPSMTGSSFQLFGSQSHGGGGPAQSEFNFAISRPSL